MIKKDFVKSSSDNLNIEIAYIEPINEIMEIVQFSHGMAEHKERYIEFYRNIMMPNEFCFIY